MTFSLSEAPKGAHDTRAGTLVDLERARVPRPLGRLAPAPTVRVLIADGQALVRAGFRVFLEDASLIRVVGEAATGDEALELARRMRPQVALVDANLPGVDCLEVTRRLLAETGAAVMLLTASERDERIFAALRAGASGLLLKDTEPAELVGAIETLARGDASLSPGLTRRVIAELLSRPQLDRPIDGLLDGRVPPAQGLHQARHQLPQRATRRAARPWTHRGTGLGESSPPAAHRRDGSNVDR
jgi:DNA-binding NarL/FixJ family response regulator